MSTQRTSKKTASLSYFLLPVNLSLIKAENTPEQALRRGRLCRSFTTQQFGSKSARSSYTMRPAREKMYHQWHFYGHPVLCI